MVSEQLFPILNLNFIWEKKREKKPFLNEEKRRKNPQTPNPDYLIIICMICTV